MILRDFLKNIIFELCIRLCQQHLALCPPGVSHLPSPLTFTATDKYLQLLTLVVMSSGDKLCRRNMMNIITYTQYNDGCAETTTRC